MQERRTTKVKRVTGRVGPRAQRHWAAHKPPRTCCMSSRTPDWCLLWALQALNSLPKIRADTSFICQIFTTPSPLPPSMLCLTLGLIHQ